MIEIALQSLLIGYSGAVMPGSLLTYTMTKSVRIGVKAGLYVAMGHALLELALVLLLFFGIGDYLMATVVQTIIGAVGGSVLLYFGINMLRGARSGAVAVDMGKEAIEKKGSLLAGGALISASNPYFFIWWAAVGLGLMMNAYRRFGLSGIALFYAGHIMADFTWYTFVSALVGTTRKFINPVTYRIIMAVLGLCLIGFGMGFLIPSTKSLITGL